MAEPQSLLDRDELERLPAESEADWYARAESAVAASRAGPLLLWAERKHPVVRIEMRRTRRARRLRTALLAAPGLLLGLLAILSLALGGSHAVLAELVLGVVCLAPLAACLGAAASAAAAVTDERRRDTAMQLALTPLPRRVIAAARVMPAVRPWLAGCAACLPVYLLAGCMSEFLSPLALWPPRLAAPFATDWSFDHHPVGMPLGLLMLASDLVLIWAAAHWGAAYAVRLGSLARVLLFVLGRLLLAGLQMLACTVPLFIYAYICIHVSRVTSPPASSLVVLAGILALLGLLVLWACLTLYYRCFLRWPARMAAAEFAGFDRLAGDEFEPDYRWKRLLRWIGPRRPLEGGR